MNDETNKWLRFISAAMRLAGYASTVNDAGGGPGAGWRNGLLQLADEVEDEFNKIQPAPPTGGQKP